MSVMRCLISVFSAATMVAGASMVSSQDYPTKPIRIVTSGVGGGSDFDARLIAQGISGPLSQSVIVDNRGGSLPAEIVSRAPSNGYTLLIDGNSFWTGPLLQKVPYDPIRDFSPITITSRSISVLVVHPSLSVKSVKELIALAKARPGEINYASGSTGGGSHISGELFKTLAGVNIVRVPFSSTGGGLISVIGGETQFMFPNTTAVTQHLKTGKLRALAVTSAEPSGLAPGLPTVAASGLPGFASEGLTGMFAPGKTPGVISVAI